MLHVGVLFNYRTPTTSKTNERKIKKAIDRHESVCYNKFKSWGKVTVEETDGHK